MSKTGSDEPPDATSAPDVDAVPVVDEVPADADVAPLTDVDELAASLVDIGDSEVDGVLVNAPMPSGWQASARPITTEPAT
ncbi:MAG: hypothetical protein H6711_24950 [Myxococcales bacterium]|nr:hypothetical protein [Myxococcales bacterium]